MSPEPLASFPKRGSHPRASPLCGSLPSQPVAAPLVKGLFDSCFTDGNVKRRVGQRQGERCDILPAPRIATSADEDRSRVRHRNAAWILAIFCRVGVILFMRWRDQDRRRTKATLPDFHEEVGLEHQRRAFAMVTSKASRALEAS
jgi:hypothetical protein